MGQRLDARPGLAQEEWWSPSGSCKGAEFRSRKGSGFLMLGVEGSGKRVEISRALNLNAKLTCQACPSCESVNSHASPGSSECERRNLKCVIPK